MDIIPNQGHVSLIVSILAVAAVLTVLIYNLRPEKKRPNDPTDDH